MKFISLITLIISIALTIPGNTPSTQIIDKITHQSPNQDCIRLMTDIAKELTINDDLTGNWCWDKYDNDNSGSGGGSGSGISSKCNFSCMTCKDIAIELYSTLVGIMETDYEYINVYNKCLELTEPELFTTTLPPPVSNITNSTLLVEPDKYSLRVAVFTIIGFLSMCALVGTCIYLRPRQDIIIPYSPILQNG